MAEIDRTRLGEEVRETLLHVIPDAGFPAGLTGLDLLSEIVKAT